MNSTLAAVALASIAAGGVAYVFIYPLLSGEARAEKRQKALVPARSARIIDRCAGIGGVGLDACRPSVDGAPRVLRRCDRAGHLLGALAQAAGRRKRRQPDSRKDRRPGP